ncbi:HAD family hydrolase [Streptomyces sp. NPDC001828]|uniref:HAD family hydrolase n=1 Tax=Streptomyces sp. NPDC001828 TaxID=3364615 RepID=UPI0036ADFA21
MRQPSRRLILAACSTNGVARRREFRPVPADRRVLVRRFHREPDPDRVRVVLAGTVHLRLDKLRAVAHPLTGHADTPPLSATHPWGCGTRTRASARARARAQKGFDQWVFVYQTGPVQTPSASPANIRAILFDSGGVLMQPIGGRWNPRADFEQTVLAHAPSITPDKFAAAIRAGDHFFDASPSTPDYDEYHRVMLHHLDVDPTSQLLADLRREVPPAAFLETYPDVVETLDELTRRGGADGHSVRRLARSPGPPRRTRDRPLLRGVCDLRGPRCDKPDPRMYHHASAALDLPPAQCLFIDDDPDLVAAAIELGYEGRALCRDSAVPDVPSITSLTELLDFFCQFRPRPCWGVPAALGCARCAATELGASSGPAEASAPCDASTHLQDGRVGHPARHEALRRRPCQAPVAVRPGRAGAHRA